MRNWPRRPRRGCATRFVGPPASPRLSSNPEACFFFPTFQTGCVPFGPGNRFKRDASHLGPSSPEACLLACLFSLCLPSLSAGLVAGIQQGYRPSAGVSQRSSPMALRSVWTLSFSPLWAVRSSSPLWGRRESAKLFALRASRSAKREVRSPRYQCRAAAGTPRRVTDGLRRLVICPSSPSGPLFLVARARR